MGNEYAQPGNGQLDLSGLLNGILSNPAALSMLASLLGNMQKPSDGGPGWGGPDGGHGGGDPHGGHGQEEHRPPMPPPCDAPAPQAPPILPPVHKPGHKKDDRACLLQALRPYLSRERCDMIETLLRILELMELFRRRR